MKQSIKMKVDVSLHAEGKYVGDTTLTLEWWGASGWRLHGTWKHSKEPMTVKGRGSYGMEEGKNYGAILLKSWSLGVPTDKMQAEGKVRWTGSGSFGSRGFESFDRYYPTLDEALDILTPGLTLYNCEDMDAPMQWVTVSKINDINVEYSVGGNGKNWLELARPHTFIPVAATRDADTKDKINIKAVDGREAFAWDTDDGIILSEINHVKISQAFNADIQRIEDKVRELLGEMPKQIGMCRYGN